MGPFFVFIGWTTDIFIDVHTFETQMEAMAFYYGMREMQHRVDDLERHNWTKEDVQRLNNRYFGAPGRKMNFISCDMNDLMSQNDNVLGHFTIYNDCMSRDYVNVLVKNAIRDMEALQA